MSCVTKGVSVRWIFVVNAEATCSRARATPRPRRVAGRAPRRPRTPDRPARAGPARTPVDVERPACTIDTTLPMNGYSGGTAAGGPILGRATEAEN